uniref:PROP1-like PPR domain-containing protein n=1 Tax=Davidia involucrata TaxID=16924 RepID=A0A5B7AQ15_DAVIN
MRAETQPIDPDHVTVGALIKACANAGQVDRAQEVYNMIHEFNIKGTPEVYTIAVNSCSQIGDWEFACSVYSDMTRKGVVPDEMFLSALIDVAGHAGKVDAAFEILEKARNQGIHIGIVSYSSLMGACSNVKDWRKALELYEDIKSIKLRPTVSTMNALITALCDGEQLHKAVDVLSEMKGIGLCPNTITYSILLVASEKKDDLEVGLMLLSQAKKDGVAPNLVMCGCLIGMCLRRYEKACMLGEPVLSFYSGWPQIDSKWTSLALMVYRETIVAGMVPTLEEFSQVLGCLQLPHYSSLRNRLIENLGVSTDTSRSSNLCSMVDGFGEYDPRAFSLLEEAASLGIVPCVSFKESPIFVDARKLQIHTAEVYLLTVLKGLKHRLAAGAKLPNITILLPIEKTQIQSPNGEKTINLAGRISQAIAALLRRLRLPYQGNESYGKIRINGIAVKRWFRPKLASPFSGKQTELSWLGKGITHQQRNIRTGNLSLD